MPLDSSGAGFFGKGYWGERVLWGNVPVQIQQLDTEGHYQQFLKSVGDEMESFLDQIYLAPSQREPYEVRGRDNEKEWFYVTDSLVWDDPYFGRVVRLIGEKDYTLMPETDEDAPPSADSTILSEQFPWFPYAPATEVGRWWKTQWEHADYDVARVRLRNYDQPAIYDANTSLGNEVWVKGGDLTVQFDYLTDDVTWRGSWTVVGTGDGSPKPVMALPTLPVRIYENDTTSPTPWLTADAKLRVKLDLVTGGSDFELYDVPDATGNGGNLYPESGTPGQIDTTTSYGTVNYLSGEISIDLSTAGDFAVYGQSISAKWMVRGYFFAFNPPPLIDRLALDFGFFNDQNDPEDVQRSTIANVTKYFGLKASQDSYRIRGEVSLFDVYARGLWHICDADTWASFPAEHRFYYGGEYYTDIDPRYIRVDDIRSDVQFYDPDTSTYKTLVDNALMYEDASADGYSTGLAFALDVVQGYYHPVRSPATVVSSTALTDPEALTLGLLGGYRVVISMTQTQYDEFSWGVGLFGLTEYDKTGATPPALSDDVWWIDADDGWNAGVLEWTVVIGTGAGVANPFPTPYGQDVAIRYWPGLSGSDCCFCRSNKIRMEISPIVEAYEHYETAEDLDNAVIRLKTKLERLVPIHAEVVDWVVTKDIEVVMSGVQQGATVYHDFTGGEFDDAYSITLTVEQRGDLNLAPKLQTFELYDDTPGLVWTANGLSGFSDPDIWYPVATATDVDVEAWIKDNNPVQIRGIAHSSVTYGDLRWTFTVERPL